MASSYTAAYMLAEAIRDSGSEDVNAVRTYLHTHSFNTVLGPIQIDQITNHAALRPQIAKFDRDDSFCIVEFSEHLVQADPYFVELDAEAFAEGIKQQSPEGFEYLRVVK